jgi:hypothetical protein
MAALILPAEEEMRCRKSPEEIKSRNEPKGER